MTVSETKLSTAARIVAVMGSIGDIPKNGWNNAQSYAFRKVEDVTVRVRDVMFDHGLGCIPVGSALVESETRDKGNGKIARSVVVLQRYEFFSVDDPTDRVPVEMLGEGADSLDKSTSKALTAAYKYALLQSFAIGEDSEDGDSSSGSETTTSTAPPADPPEPLEADDEDVERVKNALAAVHPDDLDLLRRWWKLVEFGSLTTHRLDRRLLRSFFALVDGLASVRDDLAREVVGS